MSVTTLPSLHVGGKVTQQVIKHTPQPPSSKASVSKASSGRHYHKRQKHDLLEKSLRKEDSKSNELPINTARYRNSQKHNLCLNMLQEGYHLAFRELFNLIEEQKRLLSYEPCDREMKVKLLEDDPEKLSVLKENLISAEIAKRRGRTDQLYHSQHTLAKYFNDQKDIWLSDYFYQKCLETSLQVHGDGHRKEAEANYNLGIACEEKMDFDQAVTYLEIFYNFSNGKEWEDENGNKLHKKGCESLQRLYTKIAEQIEEADSNEAVNYLQKAFEMAKEGENEKQIGQAGFRLGHAYEQNGDTDAAIKYFTDYLNICASLSDDVGRGQACHALSTAYHTLGDVSNAIHYLTMVLEIADSSGQREARGSACSGLGTLYNASGMYGQASKFFREAFESAKEVNDAIAVESTRTEYGIGHAHELFEQYTKFIVVNDKTANGYVMSWRDDRTDIEAADKVGATDRNSESNSS